MSKCVNKVKGRRAQPSHRVYTRPQNVEERPLWIYFAHNIFLSEGAVVCSRKFVEQAVELPNVLVVDDLEVVVPVKFVVETVQTHKPSCYKNYKRSLHAATFAPPLSSNIKSTRSKSCVRTSLLVSTQPSTSPLSSQASNIR